MMNENTYYKILQQLPADCKKTELIILDGDDAGSKALAADGRIAACTGGAKAREFFSCLLTEYEAGSSSENNGSSGIPDLRGTGEFFFDGRTVFYEQLEKKPRLVICGAGHVGLAICRIAAITGLETIVIDDRPEYTSQAGSAGASHVLCTSFEEGLEKIQSDARTCFVLVTRGHAHGMECLRMILRKPHLYVGMMSSKKRAAAARETLLGEGFSPGEVRSVHMPVGLKIGAETPGEIAVSVMAQVISVIRMEGSGDGYLPEILDALASCAAAEKRGCAEGSERTQNSLTAGRAEGAEHAENAETAVRASAAVLATIIRKSGEAPREPGTRMLILPDRKLLGSIGGGYAEAEVVKAAGRMMENPQDPDDSAVFLKVEMPLVKYGAEDYTSLDSADKGTAVTDESMICGGKITLLLEKICF